MLIIYILILAFITYQVLYHIYWTYLLTPNFKGKSVFITGASSGIGEELAIQLSKLGTKKIFIAARRLQELERVKSLCSKACEIEIV